MPVITRRPLRSQIRSHLVGELLGGNLEPGSQLNENELAEELGVSRTPIREACLQLAFEGLLLCTPGRGFSVAPLELEEASELFEFGVELECLALRLAGGVDPDALEELRAINAERARKLKTGDRDLLVELDDRWHRTLVADCENRQLQEVLRLIRNRLYRYVSTCEGQVEEVQKAIENHDEIATALENGDLEAAVEHLREHWEEARVTVEHLMADVAVG